MTREGWIWIGTAVLAVMFGALVGLGASGPAVIFLAVLGTVMFATVGWAVRRPTDGEWLARWLVFGFIVKLAGTAARYYMVTTLYGAGDSYRYYRVGTDLAEQWREGEVPGLTGQGSFGTQVVESVTGGIFALFTPDFLGGFLTFAVLAFIGQLLLYVAFRRWAEPHQLKPFAFFVFFLPTYAFWPSSIGKDALILLGLGLTAYMASRALEAFRIRWLGGLGLALGAVGLIRIHIAGLVVAAFVIATVVSKRNPNAGSGEPIRRLAVLGAGILAGALVVAVFPDIFGIDLTNTSDLDGFTTDVVRRTSERGTVASGGAVTSPAQIPGAIVHVLFRPFIFEGSEIQHLLAAAETTLVLGITIVKLPAMIRNRSKWRSNAFLVFSTFYVLGFSVAFSVVRNLGIIARQRGQVLAFFLAIVVGLGWEKKKSMQTLASGTPTQLDLPLETR